MTLDAWLKSKDISAESFGRQLDVTGQAVRRWSAGERMPDAEMVEKIEKATDGAVTIADLHSVRLSYLKGEPAPAPEVAA